VEELQPGPANRRLRLFLIGGALLGLVFLFGLCATISTVTSHIIVLDTMTPDIQITGTVDQIAGMPIPYGVQVTSHIPRAKGGTFDYSTPLRPQEIYNFYFSILTQRGIWRAGSQPIITENSGEFQFYPDIPRLTIITVKCDAKLCNVHVDY
jgi:hypothetical protein